MIFNMNGFGETRAFAVIHADYPAGSVCTCTNGTRTQRARNSGGAWNFLVPEGGEWTVECHDDNRSKSRSVTVAAEGQAVSVTLSYELVLYDSGTLNEALGGLKNLGLDTFSDTGGVLRCMESGTNQSGSTGYGGFNNPVSFDGYNSLCFTATGSAAGSYIRLGAAAVGASSFVAMANMTERNRQETVTVPVSGLSGSFDILISVYGHGEPGIPAQTSTLNITKIWLE